MFKVIEKPVTETTTTVAEDKTGTTAEQLTNRQPSTSETAGQTPAPAASDKVQTNTTHPEQTSNIYSSFG